MTYSGKLNLRMSSSLHEHLAVQAGSQGVSLNTWLVTLLAGASGFPKLLDAETPAND